MEFTSVAQVCFTAKSVSSTAGRRHNMDSDLRDRRHNMDSDLRDRLGRQFSPERRPSLDRSGRRVQRFSGKIYSFGFMEFCCRLGRVKSLCQLFVLYFFLFLLPTEFKFAGHDNSMPFENQRYLLPSVLLMLMLCEISVVI